MQTVTWGGLVVICLLLGVALFARRVNWDGFRARNLLPAAAVVLVLAAGWAAIRLWSTSAWLRALVDG